MNWATIDDESNGLLYYAKYLAVVIISRRSDILRQPDYQPDFARSRLLRNNGLLLHYLLRKKIKTLSRAKRFASYLRFTPSDFAAVGIPWP